MATAGGPTTDGVAVVADPGAADDGSVVAPEQAAWSIVLVLAALSAAAIAQGAYYATGGAITGVLLLAAGAVGIRSGHLRLAELRWSPVAACVAFAVWAMVSAALAGASSTGLPIVLLLAALVGVATLCRGAGAAVAEGLVSLGVLIAASGLAGVAWQHEPLALEGQGLWRAATTLTYPNAAAGLLVPLALLAIGRLVASPRSAADAGALCVLLAGIAATMSRGGVASLLMGAGILARLIGSRRVLTAILGPMVGAVVVVAALTPSMAVNRSPAPLVAVSGLALGILVAVRWPRRGPKKAAAAVGAVVLAGCLLITGAPSRVLSAAGGTRLTISSDDRANEAVAALGVAASNPIAGAGPGNALLTWSDVHGAPLVARYAHNEYLQTLAEFGIIGLALIVVLGVALTSRVRAGLEGHPEPLAAGAAAGLAAFALHSGMDFLWHVPVLPLIAAALVGICCQLEQGDSS